MAGTFTITAAQAEALAIAVGNGDKLTFTNLANRDWVAKLARKRGHKVRKYSMRNQLLDPRYTVEGSHIPDRGLANDYKHYYAAIYCLEREHATYW